MATSDPASKARTMAHMNKEHTEDLALYLQHFGGLSASAAADSPHMTDIDVHSMSIATASNGVHVVPFNPPMASWADRRARLVDMSNEARAAVGGGPGARFVPPEGLGIISFCGLAVYFAVWAANRVGLLEPGTAARSLLEAIPVPNGPATFKWLVDTIFLPVIAIHLAEIWWLDRTRLSPAGVKRFSRDWNLWMLNGFMEGKFNFDRFDRVHGAKISKGSKSAKEH